MRTPVAYYSNPEKLPDPLSQLVPASYLTVSAEQKVPPKPQHGRALVGIEFGLPGAHYRGFCRPEEDIEMFIRDDELDLDLSDVTKEKIVSTNLDTHSLMYRVSEIVRDLGMTGIVSFDYMRKEPPFGAGFLARNGISVYTAFFKNPHDDWLTAFVPSKPSPYNSLEMRSNIAHYAIQNPDKFNFRQLTVSPNWY